MANSSSSASSELFQKVNDKTFINTLLQSLVRRRVLVSIRLPSSDVQYISTVLDLDLFEGFLLIDEVFPLGAGKLLEKSQQLKLEAHLGGAIVSFITEFQTDDVPSMGSRIYRLALPQTVDYLQRREGHRVNVAELEIHAELYDHQGKVHRGYLHDISTGGVSLIIPSAKGFHRNGVYRCSIQLASATPYVCKLDICTIRDVKAGQAVGGSYVELDKQQKMQLSRVVAELERRLMRRRWEPSDKASTD